MVHWSQKIIIVYLMLIKLKWCLFIVPSFQIIVVCSQIISGCGLSVALTDSILNNVIMVLNSICLHFMYYNRPLKASFSFIYSQECSSIIESFCFFRVEKGSTSFLSSWLSTAYLMCKNQGAKELVGTLEFDFTSRGTW